LLTSPRPEPRPRACWAFRAASWRAFEAEGFIWGGKWAAFDLMHFEYGPS
jgi:hypothetical protein